MKVSRRSVPQDSLSLEKGNKRIHIFTHRSKIVLNAGPVGCCGMDRWLTFEELFQLIQTIPEKDV